MKTCEVLPGNINLWRFLWATSRQWRMVTVGTNGAVISQANGLDMAAIAAMAPAFGLTQNQIFFEKLRAFEAACLDIWNPQGCTEKKKANCEAQHGAFLEWACSKCPDKNNGSH